MNYLFSKNMGADQQYSHYVAVCALVFAYVKSRFSHDGVEEHGGLVVEPRTPDREVGGSIPISAVLCP